MIHFNVVISSILMILYYFHYKLLVYMVTIISIQMQKNKGEQLSRSQMLSWINRILHINETRIQNLGSGVIYCLLLNHYCPGAITPSKIIMIPRNINDYRTNLRKFQQGMSSHDIRTISFDVFKVSEMTYTDNWTLICKLYKHFSGAEKEKPVEINKELKELWWNQKSFEPKSQQNIPTFALNHNPISMNSLSTPIKGSKFLQQGKSRWQSMNLIEQIKKIVTIDTTSDRVKVAQLRRLLGLQDEEGQQLEPELRDLLSDYKKKQEVIQID